MDKRQYRRILASFIVTIVLLVIGVILMIIIINKPKDIQIFNYVGKDGVSVKGDKGDSPTQEELVALIKPLIPAPIKGDAPTKEELIMLIKPLIPTPIKGEKGDIGGNALPQIVWIDYGTCILMSKYEGDRIGQELAQLPKPCEVYNDK